MPIWKIFFLPQMSANRPSGTKKAAAASVYEVATQFNETAFSDSWSAIDGRAMLTEDARKGVRKELNMATIRTTLLLVAGSCAVITLFITGYCTFNNWLKSREDDYLLRTFR
jgi:hypothetical protein